MMECKADFAVAVDDAWKSYWQRRYGKVDFDTESLSVGETGGITELGLEDPPMEKIDARYIGLLKFSLQGMDYIRALLNDAKKNLGDKPWQQSCKPVCQAYMTDLLNAVIESGKKVQAVRFEYGWLEFDTNEDYEKAMEWKEKGELGELKINNNHACSIPSSFFNAV